MIHAYCVRRAGEPPPGSEVTGLGGAAVRLIEEGGLGLWVSDVSGATVTAERLREHDCVVRHALRSGTPLPIRYGAGAFPSEAAAREALGEKAAELAESLARLAGHVEMGVRVDWDQPVSQSAGAHGEPPAPEGGRAYLEARREALRERDALLEAASAALDRVEREMALDGVPSTRTMLPRSGTAGIVAHLVRRTDAARYAKAVAAAREALPEYRITPSGPWAPYSFS